MDWGLRISSELLLIFTSRNHPSKHLARKSLLFCLTIITGTSVIDRGLRTAAISPSAKYLEYKLVLFWTNEKNSVKDILISHVKISIYPYSEFACSKDRQCTKLSRVSLVYRKMVVILVDCLSGLVSFGLTLSCCIRCQLFVLALIASSDGVNRTCLLTAGRHECDETGQTFKTLWDQFNISNCMPDTLYPKYQIQDQILSALYNTAL